LLWDVPARCVILSPHHGSNAPPRAKAVFAASVLRRLVERIRRMACRLVVTALLLLVAGCRNRPPQLDPFLGRTTVPPPATGAVGAGVPNVLSYPAAPPTFTTPPTGGAGVSTPGSFVPNTSSPISQPLSGTTAPGTSGPAAINVSTPIRVVPPDPNRRVVVGPSSSGGVDIMDLPVRGQGTQPKTAVGNGGAGALQSYNATSGGSGFNVDNAVARVVTLPGQQTNYGYDEAYSRLSGRLEYSSLDGRWLLRYVSPDGRPDRFGGVAILVPSGTMNGFRNGDFVTADGRLDASGSASPVFTASALALQREIR
jgi:hypothetical protein